MVKHYARILISKEKCREADRELERSLALNPFDEQIRVMKNMALSCYKPKHKVPEKLVARWPELMALKVKSLVQQNENKSAQKALSKLLELDSNFPRAQYWKWKLSKSEDDKRAAGLKYVELCKAKYADSYLDVNLCKDRDLVNQFLKSKKKEVY